ncbi:MAG TPA: choice-of-anchor C family protein [Tepidisphaeraceae bacterium]|nr:choice-of-anchor C family protein [Tepidisphaeraceae bacterium]
MLARTSTTPRAGRTWRRGRRQHFSPVPRARVESMEARLLLAAAVSGTKYNDLDGDGVRDPGEGGLPGFTIYSDADQDNQLDGPETRTVQSTNVPRVIPRGRIINPIDPEFVPGYAVSTLSASGIVGRVVDVDVNLNMSATNPAVSATLYSPSGTILLFQSLSGSLVDTTLDDEAPTSVAAGSSPYTGRYRPLEPLATFDGTNPNGTWQLEFVNESLAAGGTLNSWSITVTTEVERSTVTDANGNYTLTGLAPGVNYIREVLRPEWVQTAPTGPGPGAAQGVILADGETRGGVNFGNRDAAAVPPPPRDFRFSHALCDESVFLTLIDPWDGETGFEVQRATAGVNGNPGAFATVSNLGPMGDLGYVLNVATDSTPGLVMGQTYFYRARTLGGAAGNSDWTAPVRVRLSDQNTAQYFNGHATLLPGPDGDPFTTADNVLRLTDNANSQWGTWNLIDARHVETGRGQGFSAGFDFRIPESTPGPADGFTFMVHRAPPWSAGAPGGALGYAASDGFGGVQNSVALKIDFFPGPAQVGFYANAHMDDVADSTAVANVGFNFANGHRYRAAVDYVGAGNNARVRITDLDDPTAPVFDQTFTHARTAGGNVPLDIPAIIGGECALFGFTGGTGALNAEQQITRLDINGQNIPFGTAPAAYVTGATLTEGDAGPASATFTIGLAAPTGVPVTVQYATSDGSATSEGNSPNVLTGGGFESPPVAGQFQTFGAGQQMGSWTVESGSVDLVAGWQDAEGNQSVDLSGAGAGAIYLDLATVPGQNYVLRFAMAGNPEAGPAVKQMAVDFGGVRVAEPTFDTTGRNTSNMGWTRPGYLVTATGTTTRVRFASLTGGTAGPMLDDVSLRPVDYLAASGTVTFAPGETTKTVSVPVFGDVTPEGAETIFLDITPGRGARLEAGEGRAEAIILDDDPVAPTVTAVYVNGTGWSQAFRDELEEKGLGDATHGFLVTGGAAQLSALPWSTINKITLLFSADVSVQEDDLGLASGAGIAYGYLPGTFAYSAARYHATWTLDKPLAQYPTRRATADRVRLRLDASGVRGAGPGGERLDGEWADGADAYPSGNGSPGGDFRFQINAVPGDANRNGNVSPTDYGTVRSGIGRNSTDEGASPNHYTVFKDINANGNVSPTDIGVVRGNTGANVANVPTPAALQGAPSIAEELFGMDRIL